MSYDLDSIERMRDSATGGGGKRPEDMSPQELHSALWKILTFRDSCRCCFCFALYWVGVEWFFFFCLVMKKIEITIGSFPFFNSFFLQVLIYLFCRENPRFGVVGGEDF